MNTNQPTPKVIGLEQEYGDDVAAITKPDAVIVFPRYLIERWARIVGVKAMWMYVVMRQASCAAHHGLVHLSAKILSHRAA